MVQFGSAYYCLECGYPLMEDALNRFKKEFAKITKGDVIIDSL